eukprot:scaffold767_cov288-Chaetoceros_neogracile.AAC.10
MKFSIASTTVLSLSIISQVSSFSTIPNTSIPRPPTSSSTCIHSQSQSQSQSHSSDPMTEIKLYNSLSNSKETFKPIKPNAVSMYTCGPTVYDYAHVGNFRAFLTYDVLKRALQYFGYEVDHICNLTDVDDKIINKCTELDISLKELTGKFEMKFMDDLEALNIIKAREYPRATEHIDEMVELIQLLHSKGLAYQSSEGSWYFNVDAKEGYGQQLIKLDVDNMKQNASGLAGKQRTDGGDDDVVVDGDDDDDNSDDNGDDTDINTNSNANANANANANTDSDNEEDMDADEYDADKVGMRDFALWKAYKPKFDREDATWDTPIGKGRPGWHLECSAMARKYLGDSIDLHCGGIDLKFPHHENEIAQSEGATGGKFCNCWLHNGFVNIGDEKMSKSKGNFLTLRTACSTSDDVRAYRYLIVSSQYRNPLSFTDAAMGAAKGALKRMDNVMKQLDDALDGYDLHGDIVSDGDMVAVVQKELHNFETAVADDLSMPRAAASLFGVVKAAETEFKRYKKAQKDDASGDDVTSLDLDGLGSVKNAIVQMDRVFGVFYDVPKEKNDDGSEKEEEVVDDSISEEVMELVRSRTEAKEAKDWGVADLLRGQITDLGFAVKDVKGGDPIVTRI